MGEDLLNPREAVGLLKRDGTKEAAAASSWVIPSLNMGVIAGRIGGGRQLNLVLPSHFVRFANCT